MGDTAKERMHITSTGNVGIGTASPDQKLTIVDGGAETQVRGAFDTYTTTAGYGSVFALRHSNSNTKGTLAATVNGQILGSVGGYGVNSGNAAFVYGGGIAFLQNGSAGSSRVPLDIQFSTSPGGTTAPIERMRITSTGNVGIGIANPSYKLDVNSGASIGIYVDSNVSAAGYITRTNVFDTTKNGSALNLIKDASNYLKLDSKGNTIIDHNAFAYSKVSYPKTVFDKMIITKVDENVFDKTITRYYNSDLKEISLEEAEKEYTKCLDLNKEEIDCSETKNLKAEDYEIIKEYTTVEENIYKTIQVDVETPTYKEIQEDGILLDKEVALVKQATFELKDTITKLQTKINTLEQENNLIKSELCKRNKTYIWCKTGIGIK